MSRLEKNQAEEKEQALLNIKALQLEMAKVIDDKITLEVEAVKEKLEIDKATKEKSLLEVNNSTL